MTTYATVDTTMKVVKAIRPLGLKPFTAKDVHASYQQMFGEINYYEVSEIVNILSGSGLLGVWGVDGFTFIFKTHRFEVMKETK